jgi:hypothetical protein
MRRLRIVLAASLAIAGLGVLAGPSASAASRPASFCGDYKKAIEKGISQSNFDTSKINSNDPNSLKKVYKETAKLYKSLEKDGPKELRSSFKVLRKFAEKLAKIDFNDPSSFGGVFTSADTQKLAKASGKISNYFAKKCGVDTSKYTVPS